MLMISACIVSIVTSTQPKVVLLYQGCIRLDQDRLPHMPVPILMSHEYPYLQIVPIMIQVQALVHECSTFCTILYAIVNQHSKINIDSVLYMYTDQYKMLNTQVPVPEPVSLLEQSVNIL